MKNLSGLHIIITGRVHGVSFRYWVCRRARELNLSGWVRNNPDGSVEILAEGKHDDLERLLSWCRTGPEEARVDNIEAYFEAATGEFKTFDIIA